MEYLVEFDVHVPEGTAELLVAERTTAEAAAAAELADQGYLVRLWKLSDSGSGVRALGLFRAATETELDALLAGLPLYEWMHVTVIRLDAHPNDPSHPPSNTGVRFARRPDRAMSTKLPVPRLTRIYRLEATLGPRPGSLTRLASNLLANPK